MSCTVTQTVHNTMNCRSLSHEQCAHTTRTGCAVALSLALGILCRPPRHSVATRTVALALDPIALGRDTGPNRLYCDRRHVKACRDREFSVAIGLFYHTSSFLFTTPKQPTLSRHPESSSDPTSAHSIASLSRPITYVSTHKGQPYRNQG